ncbi:MAG: hypothetical protein ACOYBS_08455 [Flavobacterium sp.]
MNKLNLKKLFIFSFNLPLMVICFFSLNSFSQEVRQVKRTVIGNGTSIIRENIEQNKEFNFFRDWNKIAILKSGIGETVELFPVVFIVPEKKIELYGLQLDVEVKPQKAGIEVQNSGSIFNLVNKNFIKRSIFIDKADVLRLITGIQRDVVPEIKNIYKKKSKEYVFKSNELFFSFFIYEKKARITMHIIDYGPGGDSKDGEQIEFWTESKVDDIPEFLETLKALYSTMK